MTASAAPVTQHLLALILILLVPVVDYYDMRKLKAGTDSKRKLHFYLKSIVALWSLTAIAWVVVGFRSLFTISAAAEGVPWLSANSWERFVVAGPIAALMVVLLLQAVWAIRNEKVRTRYTKAVQFLSFILPVTVEERQWWAAVCVSAGVCEEVLYRGFLLHYFRAFPFYHDAAFALFLSSAIFGVGHLYLGTSGAVHAAAMGFFFGIIFLMTGSLLVPIVLHVLIDLRVLLMLNAGTPQAEPSGLKT